MIRGGEAKLGHSGWGNEFKSAMAYVIEPQVKNHSYNLFVVVVVCFVILYEKVPLSLDL